MMPNQNGCFIVNNNAGNITKQSSEYFCYIKGGSLISFETLDKINIVKNNISSKFFWLNSAIYRNSTLKPTWVWSSGIKHTLKIIDYDNWGVNQSNNFNGDALYVNTTDFKFYAGTSNELKVDGAIVCESSLYGLGDSNINIIENNRTIAFTKYGDKILQIQFSLNITPGPNIEIRRIRTPNISTYIQNAKYFSLDILTDDIEVFPLTQSFYIDICGTGISKKFFKLFEITLLKTWLAARPGKMFCIP
jgi:hypothetical protein